MNELLRSIAGHLDDVETRIAQARAQGDPDAETSKAVTPALGALWQELAKYQTQFGGMRSEDPRFVEYLGRYCEVASVLENPDVPVLAAVRLALEHDRHDRPQAALDALLPALEAKRNASSAQLPLLLTHAARVAIRVGPAHYEQAIAWLDRVEKEFANSLAARFDIALGYYGTRVELATAFGNLDQIATWQRIERATLAEYQLVAGTNPAALADVRRYVVLERTHAVQAALALGRDDEAISILDELLQDPLVTADETLRKSLESRKRVAVARQQRMKELPSDVEARLAALAASRDPDRLLELRQIAMIAIYLGKTEIASRCVEAAGIDPSAAPKSGSVGMNEGILLCCAAKLRRAEGADPKSVDAYVAAVRSTLSAQLEQIRRSPVLEAGAGFLNYTELRQFLCQVVALELDIGPPDDAKRRVLDWILKAQATGTLARSLSLATPTLDRVRSRILGPKEGALVFLPAVPSGYVLAIDADSLLIEPIDSESKSKSIRLALRDTLLSEPAHVDESLESAIQPAEIARAREACEAFVGAFLPPAIRAEMRNWRAVAVVGAESIDGLALEPLSIDGSGIPLGVTHTIRYLPSFAIGDHVLRETQSEPKQLLHVIAATAAPEADLAEIPFGSDDVAEFRSVLGQEVATFAIGEQASQAALTSPEAQASRMWLILAHGSFDPTQPLPGGVFLAGKDAKSPPVRVGVSTVNALTAADVVLLAACGTQRGPRRKGDDGPQHLAGAFLRAGARSVVASKGDLEYHATRVLALETLKRLAEGDSLGEALRRARIELRKMPQFDHPFYYATWQLLGRG